LKLDVQRGRHNGLSREEIMHMAIYGGFPVAVEGFAVAKAVFDAES